MKKLNKNLTPVTWLMKKLLFAGIKNLDLCDDIYIKARQMEKEQIEISDMEIYYNAPVHDGSDYSIGQHHGFIEGAKWYRKQIKIIK